MDAMKAGLMAWGIEALIALSMLFILKHEEQKVFKRREGKNENNI